MQPERNESASQGVHESHLWRRPLFLLQWACLSDVVQLNISTHCHKKKTHMTALEIISWGKKSREYYNKYHDMSQCLELRFPKC